ncbi:putative TPR repeat-containing protein [Candidatus Terasakiella magnetica]|nr:putative TPR repeat-containing protein [Candidatus Terasakiella magnetica]
MPEADKLFTEALAHQVAGRLDLAAAGYRQGLKQSPLCAEAHNNLGNILQDLGRLPEAEASFGRALAARPDYAEAHYNLGNCLKAMGRREAAEQCFTRVLHLRPDFMEASNRKGACLRELGRLEQAAACFRDAVARWPDQAAPHGNLGVILVDLGHYGEAEASCRNAVTLNPGSADAYYNLGNAARERGRLDAAAACYRWTLAISPDYAGALGNLGNTLRDLGHLEEAQAYFRRTLDIRPDCVEAHSNLLITMAVMPRFDGAAILEQAKHFGEICEAPFRQQPRQRHGNTPDPERRLRIGFLTPSLIEHVLATDLEPVFRCLPRDKVSVHVYAHVPHPDAITWRLKELCDTWTFVNGLTDDQVAAQIEGDGIDILIDPMGHWASNRLAVFAHKPAPIQVSYLCQGLTSGLSAMDYSIGDRWLNQDGAMQAFATERVIELSNGFEVTCVNRDAPIGPLPSEEAGFITFGSFNNPTKISDKTLELWGKVLHRIPTSRLLIKGRLLDRSESREHLLERLERHGITADRADLFGFVAAIDHMEWYNRVDMVLDTLPFCGGRTTVEALWMGVPVVTLIGDTVVGRYSYSHLSRLGAPELAALNTEAFVEISATLAGDTARLRHYRSTLRDSLRASSLFNATLHNTELEQAFRTMWRAWCEGKQ